MCRNVYIRPPGPDGNDHPCTDGNEYREEKMNNYKREKESVEGGNVYNKEGTFEYWPKCLG